MSGLPWNSSQPHARWPHSFLGMDACVTSRLNVDLVHKLRVSLVCLAYYFWHVIHGCLYNHALVDVRSTGAGIKCLHCKVLLWILCGYSVVTSLYVFMARYITWRYFSDTKPTETRMYEKSARTVSKASILKSNDRYILKPSRPLGLWGRTSMFWNYSTGQNLP